MTTREITPILTAASALFCDPCEATPIHLVGVGGEADVGHVGRRWLAAQAFMPTAKKQALIAGPDGTLAAVALGVGNAKAGEPCGPSELLIGQLAQSLPGGTYVLAQDVRHPDLAALAWGLGAYRFRRYKSIASDPAPKFVWPTGADRERVLAEIEAVWLGRDLINTPANDMGPDDIENAARELALRHGATITVVAGDELLAKNFPLIHAVGRASPRAPRLIDLTWGAPDARAVTLVGKGIVFDTGGLDIKPASGMLLMKKDMGGAATALALGHMIMAQKLPVRLRILIPVAENAISGDAFRPSDVIKSRAGVTVEIGNTDAEGRLVLADALALADEESPSCLLTFSTLTGAARVALGPDLPAFFTDDEALAASIATRGQAIGDPVWRLPFWSGYERNLDSEIADMNNVSESPFSGAITAALFLRRFVKSAASFAHFDLYGWRPATRPLGPKGGEPQTARTVFDHLRSECGG
jgi:leucyl aminopeptidase